MGKIRQPDISMYASACSSVPTVRAFLLEAQKKLARENSVIMDGRDIGTVILPDAEVKVFLTATDEARATRRYKELTEKEYARLVGEMAPKSPILKDCVLAFLVILFFGKDMVSLFVDADDPAIIAEVLNKAHQYLVVNGAIYIPLLFVNILRFTIQGVGFTTVAMTAGLMELIGRGIVAIILVPFFGYDAAVWANPVAWILADVFLFPCLITVMKWLHNRMLLTGQATQSPKEYKASHPTT